MINYIYIIIKSCGNNVKNYFIQSVFSTNPSFHSMYYYVWHDTDALRASDDNKLPNAVVNLTCGILYDITVSKAEYNNIQLY